MIILREVTIHEPEAIICDRCHRRAECNSDHFEFQEYLSIDNIGGYGSVIGDGTRFQIDLCQHCVKELLLPYARLEEL